jgi:hypothetical protein
LTAGSTWGNYDAERTLEEFGAMLRSAIDLDHLQAHLVKVIEKTMHPEHISLWLRPDWDHSG